ncbi:MAG: hypothetical protein JWM34_4790 [Ilumatobacteraceae bacterium]|nr:hypothetical protein [Ilumatobacteraceae bacterium]
MNRFSSGCATAIASVFAAAVVCVGASASVSHAADVATFHGLSPARLMDTRSGMPTIDGQFAAGGKVAANGSASVTVVGRGGVPSTGVGAVALNVTVTNPTGSGYLTVFPAGQQQPTASNLNFTPGLTIPNMVLVPVGAGGQVTVFNSAGTSDVIVDVLGWFPTGAAFTGLNPARLLDTRPGFATIDAAFAGAGPVQANKATSFAVTGRGGVPASGVGAVALNVTVTDPDGPGYLTVAPDASKIPTASNLNFTPKQTIPNMVVVPVAADGSVAVFNGSGGTANVIVDVLGWFPTGTAFSGLTPARLLDTRFGSLSTATIDGIDAGGGAIPANSTLNVVVTGRGGVPASGAGAVALNVTVTNPTGSGYLTVYPAGTHAPTASNLNFIPGQTIPNMVIVPVGNNGEISIFNSAGSSDVLVDVLGWFPNPTDPPTAFGNALTLAHGALGTTAFGAAPDATIAPVQAFFGAPDSDTTATFPTLDSSTGIYTAADGRTFYYPFSRTVCFGHGTFCVTFGGASASALTFTGYSYFNDPQALLFDANGLGMGSRASDFAGAMSYTAGGSTVYGTGMSTSGLYLTLFSRQQPFAGTDGSGNPTSFTPDPHDVYVTGLFAGILIQPKKS